MEMEGAYYYEKSQELLKDFNSSLVIKTEKKSPLFALELLSLQLMHCNIMYYVYSLYTFDLFVIVPFFILTQTII